MDEDIQNAKAELDQALADFRAKVFVEGAKIEDIEASYADFQRKVAFYRVALDLVQTRAMTLAREKLGSLEELTLFQGSLFLLIRDGLLAAGATEEEASVFLFGEGSEDSALREFAEAAMSFAKMAEHVRAMSEGLIHQRMQERVREKVLTTILENAQPSEEADKSQLN